MTRADKRALAAAVVCTSIFATVGSLILPALTLNLEARGESSLLIGAFGALLGFAALVGAPFAPVIVRRLGAGRALSLLLCVAAAADLAYPLFADSTAAWFAIYFVSSLTVVLVFIIAETVITSLAPPSRRGLTLGLYAAAFSGGFAIGPVILRFTGVDGWAPFVAAAGLALAGAAAALAVKKGATPPQVAAGFWRPLFIAPLPFVCAFSLGAAEMSVYDLLPVYARKLEFQVAGAVFLLTVFSIGTLLMQPLAGVVADKFGPGRMLFLAAVGGVAGAAALPFLLEGAAEGASNPARWTKLACLGAWGGMLMAVYPLGLAQMARTFPKAKLAAANALFGFSYGGGALCGPLLTGAAMDISPHGIAPSLAIFAALPLFALLFCKREISEERNMQ